jgi:hypothetical protein
MEFAQVTAQQPQVAIGTLPNNLCQKVPPAGAAAHPNKYPELRKRGSVVVEHAYALATK